jgi:Pacifastin inhibitor (LCMII)/Kazal-type serine protease inhibitor domain
MRRIVTDCFKSFSRGILAGAAPVAWTLAGVAALSGCDLYDFGEVLHGSHGHGHGSGGGGTPGGDPQVCEFDGGVFQPGDSFPSSDGCNQCFCNENGDVACTERACLTLCGGLLGASCPDGQFCSFPPEAQCGAGDQTGVCSVQPEVCNFQYDPVCGCDGETYGNACTAAAAGVSVSASGECGVEPGCQSDSDCPVPPCVCLDEDGNGTCDNTCPVPRCDGGECTFADPVALQLGDSCGGYRPLGSPECDSGLFCQYQPGAVCGSSDFPGECVAIPQVCPYIFDPVCGCDGQTYSNACEAAAQLASILDVGACL